MDNEVAGGVGCGVGFTITTFRNDGMPVVEVVVAGGSAGASNMGTVIEGTGDGPAISMVHIRAPCGWGCL